MNLSRGRAFETVMFAMSCIFLVVFVTSIGDGEGPAGKKRSSHLHVFVGDRGSKNGVACLFLFFVVP